MSDAPTTTWLTQESYDRLSAELEELSGPARADIAKKIESARDEGDLKENGGYHAAREELGKIDGRVKQLIDMLERAQVGETPADDGVVEPGMKVTADVGGLSQEFLLGAREMAGEGIEIDVFSPQSPLGQAIIGSRTGDTVAYETPLGKTVEVKILEAVPYSG
jgi:transcription elongation factor GreA